jgi:hypothetical protein
LPLDARAAVETGTYNIAAVAPVDEQGPSSFALI